MPPTAAAALANAAASFVTEAIRDDSTAAGPGVLARTATPPPAYPIQARPSLTAAMAAWPYRAAESARITHSSFDSAYSPARSDRGPPGPVIRPPAALRPEIPPGYGFVEEVIATLTLTVRPLMPPSAALTLARNVSNAFAAPFSLPPSPGTHPNAAAAPWTISPSGPRIPLTTKMRNAAFSVFHTAFHARDTAPSTVF